MRGRGPSMEVWPVTLRVLNSISQQRSGVAVLQGNLSILHCRSDSRSQCQLQHHRGQRKILKVTAECRLNTGRI